MGDQKLSPEQTIKTYQMKEGDYTVTVKVLQANDLRPLKSTGIFGLGGSQQGSVDSLVVVEVEGKSKKSKVKKDELSPKYNQTFTFSLPKMKKEQLGEGTVKFSVLDKKSSMFGPTVLGVYQIDFTEIYFSYQHQMYRTWLTLSDPSGNNQGAIMGYLLVDICLMGPQDEPPVHDLNQQKAPGAAKDKVLVPRKIAQIGHQIILELYRGEHFAPLDSTGPENDAYLLATFAGSKVTSSVNTSRNPEWNEELKIGCMLPNNSKYIICSVYDYDLIGDHDLLGTFKIPFSEIKEKETPPQWVNLYGSALLTDGPHADLMNLHGDTMGSHYRGRILYKATSQFCHQPKSNKRKLEFQFPQKPIPSAPQKSYILRVDLFEAVEIPDQDREHCIIHIVMGPYLLHSQPVAILNGQAKIYQNLPDKRVFMPVDISEIPDIIIYYCDQNQGKRRHSFYRMTAAKALCGDQNRYAETHKPQVIKLKQDRALDLVADDEFPGFLYARVQLLSMRPPQREMISVQDVEGSMIDFQLRVFLYVARGIPPSDECGTSDPFCQIRCAGKNGFSTIKYKTCNPGWYETIEMDVKLPPFDGTALIPAGMFIMIFDSDVPEPQKADDPKAAAQTEQQIDPSQMEDKDLIGRIWVTMDPVRQKFKNPNPDEQPIDILYRQPKWYNVIYDVTDEAAGQVLFSYSLIKAEDASKVPIEPRMYPRVNKVQLHIFLIGLRDIDDDKENPKIQCAEVGFDVSGDDNDPVRKETEKNTFNVNEHIIFDLDVPRNQNFCPVIDIFAWDISNKQPMETEKPLLGYGVINLMDELQIYRPIPTDGEIPQVDSDDEDDQFLQKGKFETVQVPEQKNLQLEGKEGGVEDPDDFNPEDLVIPWEMPKKFQVVDDDLKTQFDSSLSMSRSRRDKIAKEKIQEIKRELGELVIDQASENEQLDKSVVVGDAKQGQNLQANNLRKTETPLVDGQEVPPRKIHPLIDNQGGEKDLENMQIEFEIIDENLKSEEDKQMNDNQIDEDQLDHHGPENNQLNINPPPKVMARPQEALDSQQDQIQKIKQVQISKPEPVMSSLYEDIDDFACNEEGGKFQEPLYKSINVRNVNYGEEVQGSSSSNPAVQETQNRYRLDDPEPNNISNNLQHQQQQQHMQDVYSPAGLLNNQFSNINNGAILERSVIKDMSVSSQPFSNFQVATNLSFSKATKVSSHALSVRGLPQAVKDVDTTRRKQKKSSSKEKKSLLSIFRKKDPELDIQTYEDYDTDQGQDLDMTPDFLRDRDVFNDDLQDKMSKNKKLKKYAMKKGQLRGGQSSLLSNEKPPEPTVSCYMKCIFLEETAQMTPDKIEQKMAQYQQSLRPKQYLCRLYVLDGLNIIAGDGAPDLFLKFNFLNQTMYLKNETLRKGSSNPQFFHMQEFKMKVPGNVFIDLEVWMQDGMDEELVGTTQIDIEDRYFNKDWYKYANKKPIEARNLLPQYGSNSVGRIRLWIDLIDMNKLKSNIPIPIYPPPQYEFELRVIIWETRWCVFKDQAEKCNDLFVQAKIGNSEWQETDTHWRCRAKGSFNWRMKWDVKFPLGPDDYGNDKLKVQLWDKDIVASNDLVGETQIDLNQHQLIQKAIKRKASTQMMMRVIEKRGIQSDRLWFDVYHPLFKDDADRPISQGQFRITVELVPKDIAQQKPNGYGRDTPNILPFLEEPTGRLKFDLLNPLGFIKDIIGPDLYNKICNTILCLICTVIFVGVGWLLLSQVFAVSLAG